MFAYIEGNSYLHQRNPIIKLVGIILITILVSISFSPILPVFTYLTLLILLWVNLRCSLTFLLKKTFPFVCISVTFMVSLLFLRGISPHPDATLHLVFLHFQWVDILKVTGLGTRILALATLSLAFVLTTRPRDLIISLILQLHIPVLHGYAALVAYRFLPDLSHQVEQIQLAHKVRGYGHHTPLQRLVAPFKMILPLMSTAIRQGEQSAYAMESRGLGFHPKRSFLYPTRITRKDIMFLGSIIFIYTILMALLIYFDLLQMNFQFLSSIN